MIIHLRTRDVGAISGLWYNYFMKADTSRAEKKLKQLTIDAIKANERAALKAGLLVQAKAQVYPAKAPGSTYRRTGTLGRRWETSVRPVDGVVGAIVNNPTNYASHVKGITEQRPIFKKIGWATIMDDAQAVLPEIVEAYQGEYDELAKKYDK